MNKSTFILIMSFILLITGTIYADSGKLFHGNQIERFPALSWIKNEQVKLVIANNGTDDKSFSIGVGAYFLKKPVVEHLTKIIVPKRTVLVKSIDLPESVTVKKNVKIKPRYIFLSAEKKDYKAIRIQGLTANLNYGFSNYIVSPRKREYFYILESDQLFDSKLFYYVSNRYRLNGQDKEGNLIFKGIESLGIKLVNKYNLEKGMEKVFNDKVKENYILQMTPKGAIFEFTVLNLKNANLASIEIKRVEKTDAGMREGYVKSPEFLIIGKNMKVIKK